MVCKSSLSLDTQKKNSLSQSRLYTFQISLSLRFQNHILRAFLFFGPEERESSSEKKEEHQKHPQSCVVLTLFSAKVRARFENERERERDGELFLRREREISSTFR